MNYIAIRKKVSIWSCSIDEAAYDEGWDEESGVSPEDFLSQAGYTFIAVPDMGTAKKLALNYEGESKFQVRKKAFEIISEMSFEEWIRTKKEEVASLVKNGSLSFKRVDGSSVKVFYEGESSEFTKCEFDDWDYDPKVPEMLDIDYKDLILFLIEVLGVENDN